METYIVWLEELDDLKEIIAAELQEKTKKK